MSKNNPLFGRRDLLAGLGRSALFFSPLMQSLSATAAGNAPKRVILMCMPNGRSKGTWYGNRRSNTDFDLHEILSPIHPYKQDLVMMRGNYMDIASHRGDGHFHGNVFAFTGYRTIGGTQYKQLAGGPSLEFAIQKALFPNKAVLPIGIDYPNIWRIAWSGRNTPARTLDTPGQTFDAVFNDFNPSQEMQNTGVSEVAKAKFASRLKILDLVSKDINGLMAKLAAPEKEVLETHLDSIRTSIRAIEQSEREQEERTENEGAVCTVPQKTGAQDYRKDWKAQIELIADAFACDRARSASIQFDWFTHSRDPKVSNFRDNSHNYSHYYERSGNSRNEYKRQRDQMTKQYALYISELIEALKARKEGNGTVFDNSVIVWYSEISDGHDFRDMPCILFGSLGGKIRTGQFLDLRGKDGSQNNLLLGISRAMGWNINTYGDPNFCSGPTPGVFVDV